MLIWRGIDEKIAQEIMASSPATAGKKRLSISRGN